MPGRPSLARDYLEALLIAVLFAAFARTFVVQAFKIPTGSMEENLLIGDHILVNKFVFASAGTDLERRLLPERPVRRGDVVVFKYPENPARDFIKRCVGLPGDTVELVDKQLRVNNSPVADGGYTYHTDSRTYPRSPFLNDDFRQRDNFGPYTVPPESYFCLGDNRDNSRDSRFWGPVPASYVEGRALLVYWSFDGEHEPLDWAGLGQELRQLGRTALRFWSGTRWHRTLTLVR